MFFIYVHYKIAIPDLYFNSVSFDHIFLLCLRRFSIKLSYNISRFVMYQAVIQVLLSMRTHRLVNTPIQYRYILANLTISALRFSIIQHIRETEIYT